MTWLLREANAKCIDELAAMWSDDCRAHFGQFIHQRRQRRVPHIRPLNFSEDTELWFVFSEILIWNCFSFSVALRRWISWQHIEIVIDHEWKRGDNKNQKWQKVTRKNRRSPFKRTIWIMYWMKLANFESIKFYISFWLRCPSFWPQRMQWNSLWPVRPRITGMKKMHFAHAVIAREFAVCH